MTTDSLSGPERAVLDHLDYRREDGVNVWIMRRDLSA